MKKRFIFIALMMLACCENIFAQKVYEKGTQSGYYVKEGKKVSVSYIANVSRTERAKVLDIYEEEGHPEARLFPKDISAYGLEDGSRYISAEVTLNKETKSIFLEYFIHVNDSVNLYCYTGEDGKETFFVQQGVNNSQLYELKEGGNEIRELLNTSGQSEIQTAILNSYPVKASRYSLLKFYNAYIHNTTNPYRKIRFGILLGAGFGKPALNILPLYSFKMKGIYTAGIFADIPLDEKCSFHPEIIYAYSKNNSGKTEMKGIIRSNNGKHLKKSIWIPLTFRFYFNYVKGKFIPFLEAGPLASIALDYRADIIGFKNEAKTYSKRFMEYGGTLGSGIEYKLTPKQSLYFSLKYVISTGGQGDYKETSNSLSFHMAFGF